MSDIDTTISLIKQGQVAPVKQLLSTSTAPTDTIALLHASIEAMNLDILRYLLDTFKLDPKIPDFRDKIVFEATGHGRAEAFKILSQYNPVILESDLSHMGSALAHAVWLIIYPWHPFSLLMLASTQMSPYAIQVPCRRPEIEKEEPSPLAFMVKPKKVDPTENASESDTVIWNRMLDMYYEMGNWKRWLPFYGPVSVQEVKFEFVRAKDQNGLYEICRVKPVDIEQVEEEADHIIKTNETCLFNAQFTGEYCSCLFHPQDCPASLPEDFFGPQTCIQHQAAEANKRKCKLNQLHLLKECARNPSMANELKALDGMAQDSCIYNMKEVNLPQCGKLYEGNERIRGIEIIMGWQMDRIYLYGPKALAWSALGMAIISISIVAWGGQSKDWGNAMALGQLLAGSLAIIISSVRD